MASACRTAMVERGLRPGERVLLEFRDEDWTQFAAAFVAVLAAGGVAVPLRHPVPPSRRATLTTTVDAAGVVAGPGVPDADGGSGVRWTVRTGDPAAVAGPARRDGRPGQARRSPGAPASIIFTSGTTGAPRAVVCPHADLTPAWQLRLRVPAPRSRAMLTSTAVGTVAAQSVLASCLVNGVHTVVLNPFDPVRVASLVEEHGVTALSLVPATARLAVDALRRAGRTLPRVLSVVCSSAPLDRTTVAGLAEVFPAARVTNVYTITEGGPSLVSYCAPDRPPALGKVGRNVRLVDRNGRDVVPGEAGELWLRGRSAGRAYLRAEVPGAGDRGAEAGTRLVADGWIATGDLCRLDADGSLYFLDRGDDVIVSGGLNIASTVVEAAIRTHPGVLDVAVFGVPHPVLGRVAVAAAVLAEGVTVAQVREYCLAHLAPDQVPRDVTAVAELPVTASGKLRKHELAARYGPPPDATAADGAGAEASTEASTEAGRTEDLVVAALRSALGTEAVGAESNFYLLGGHSLLAAQVAADLSGRVKADVPASWVLRFPTVRELAAQLARLRGGR